MTQKEQHAELQYSHDIATAVEELLPNARVHSLGHSVICMHENTSISTIFPLTADKVDFTSKLYTNQNIDQHDLTLEQTLKLLQRIDALKQTTNEETTTAAVEPAQAPATASFYSDTRQWWSGKYPVGHESASLNLDEARKRRAKVSHVVTGSIAEQSPTPIIDPETSCKLGQNHSASDERKISPLALELANALAELARESGRADAILRGKNPEDTNEDWETVPNAFSSDDGIPEDHEDSDLEEFLRSLVAPHLRGDTTHNGHPVSLNENRDVSRPFADTMAGKVLVDLGRANGGVQFVDRSLIPPKRMLSNGDNGVEFVTENVNRYPLRYTAHGNEDTKPTKPLLERWSKIISK